MMKKKVLALLLAGVMAAGATACGSASKGQTVSGNEENSSSVAEVESSVD